MSKISIMRDLSFDGDQTRVADHAGSVPTMSPLGHLWVARLNNLLTKAAERYERRAEARRHAHLLRGLDDHVLKDIGISRADAEREAGKLMHRRSSQD